MQPPTLHYHHHLPILIVDGLGDGLKAIPCYPGSVSQLCYVLDTVVGTKKDASTSSMRFTGTLQTVSRVLRVPTYSGCSRKNLVTIELSVNSAAVTSNTSQVAKLRLQKYWLEMPGVQRSSSKKSFYQPPGFNDQKRESVDLELCIARGWARRCCPGSMEHTCPPYPSHSLQGSSAGLFSHCNGICIAFNRPLSWTNRTSRGSCFVSFGRRGDWKSWPVRPAGFFLFFRLGRLSSRPGMLA